MMLVIVWLLPVPGGPCSTKLAPTPESDTAEYCELSEGSGSRVAAGSPSSSSAGAGYSGFAMRFCMSAETTAFLESAAK